MIDRGFHCTQVESDFPDGVHADADAQFSDADIQDILLDYYGVCITGLAVDENSGHGAHMMMFVTGSL